MGSDRNGPLSGSWARQHTFGTPVEITDSTNNEGTLGERGLSRSDHVHAHGDRGGGSLHEVASRDAQDDANDQDGFLSSYFVLKRRRLAQVSCDYNATTQSATHMPADTITASSTAAVREARGNFITLATSGVSGNVAQAITTTFTEMRMEPTWHSYLRVGPTADVRHYHGYFSADPSGTAPSGLAGAGISALCFAYDSTVHGDGTWRIIVSDGTSQTTTVASASIGTGRYALDIECDDQTTDEVRFYIDNVLEATETSNLPGTSTPLLSNRSITNLAAVSKNMRIGLLTTTKSG